MHLWPPNLSFGTGKGNAAKWGQGGHINGPRGRVLNWKGSYKWIHEIFSTMGRNAVELYTNNNFSKQGEVETQKFILNITWLSTNMIKILNKLKKFFGQEQHLPGLQIFSTSPSNWGPLTGDAWDETWVFLPAFLPACTTHWSMTITPWLWPGIGVFWKTSTLEDHFSIVFS